MLESLRSGVLWAAQALGDACLYDIGCCIQCLFHDSLANSYILSLPTTSVCKETSFMGLPPWLEA